MIEIEKNKNGKCLVISVFILPDDDELIKRPFAYWHTRMEYHTCYRRNPAFFNPWCQVVPWSQLWSLQLNWNKTGKITNKRIQCIFFWKWVKIRKKVQCAHRREKSASIFFGKRARALRISKRPWRKSAIHFVCRPLCCL